MGTSAKGRSGLGKIIGSVKVKLRQVRVRNRVRSGSGVSKPAPHAARFESASRGPVWHTPPWLLALRTSDERREKKNLHYQREQKSLRQVLGEYLPDPETGQESWLHAESCEEMLRRLEARIRQEIATFDGCAMGEDSDFAKYLTSRQVGHRGVVSLLQRVKRMCEEQVRQEQVGQRPVREERQAHPYRYVSTFGSLKALFSSETEEAGQEEEEEDEEGDEGQAAELALDPVRMYEQLLDAQELTLIPALTRTPTSTLTLSPDPYRCAKNPFV